MFAPSLATDKVVQVKSNEKTQELLKATYFEISSSTLDLTQELEKSIHFEISSPTLEKTQELANSTHSEVSSFTSDKTQVPKKSTHLDIISPASNMSECAETSVSTQGLKFSTQNLSPLPLATPKNEFKRTRKRGETGHLNSTPNIQELKDKVIENDNKKKEKKTSIVKKEKTVRKSKRKMSLEKKGCSDASNTSTNKNNFVSDAACLFCEELYSQSYSKEPWICCQKCNSWCHFLCAGADKKRKKFTCELCL